MKVTVAHITTQISDKTGIKEVVVKNVIETMAETIIDNLADNRKVGIVNFGVFERKKRKAHIRENYLGTGKTVQVAEKIRMNFSPSSSALKRMNQDD
ncbi:MAG: HU family DNA-binding protein [Campylobacterales bacterium]|nr:HU family DNA-binding protein [Campylobacterales bacterium]